MAYTPSNHFPNTNKFPDLYNASVIACTRLLETLFFQDFPHFFSF